MNSRPNFALALLFVLYCALPGFAIKFKLDAARFPPSRCIWNTAHENALVIVTANVGPGEDQRVDIEIIDSSPKKNVYLHKKGIKGETRLAVTTHAEGEMGVCFRNFLSQDVPSSSQKYRVVDLDVDIGADAIDYNAIANQESLSGLETEMRKLEALVKEVSDELNYLKQREERFSGTNESTLTRVQNFSWFIIFSFVGLGVWQILHLRSFFKRKYLID